MNTTVFLTKVAEDWTAEKLAVVKEMLIEADGAVLRRSNKVEDSLLDTPNLPNFRGYLRWIIVSRLLELAIIRKRLPGITANWIPLGGVHVFEMRGKNTSVIPCHLLSAAMAPRESEYRKDNRIVNAVNPNLFAEFEKEASDELLRILLVHGGKDEEFAYLRAYTDPTDKSIYRRLSSNIMLTQSIVPTLDEESVSEPLVTLKDGAQKPAPAQAPRRGATKPTNLPTQRTQDEFTVS